MLFSVTVSYIASQACLLAIDGLLQHCLLA